MPLTPRQQQVLRFLRRFYYARTAQIRDAIAPHDRDGSITRECLRQLLGLGYVRRHEPRLLEQGKTTAPPIFILTQSGACALAAETGDVRLLLAVEPTFKDWMSLNHYCALTTLHWTIDQAIAKQQFVTQHGLLFEHEVVDPDAADPSKRYRLHTSIPGSPVKCCPDTAFETEVKGRRRVWFTEREMGSDTPQRAIAKKHKGYAELTRTGLFRRHFPDAYDFRVMAVCPNAGWRDLMRQAFREPPTPGQPAKPDGPPAWKPGAELWLFVAATELTAETFLHTPIFHSVDRGPLPLVPAPSSGGGESAGEGGGGDTCTEVQK